MSTLEPGLFTDPDDGQDPASPTNASKPHIPAASSDPSLNVQGAKAFALTNASSAHVLENFRQPPAAFSSAPFWVWNDQLELSEVRPAMESFAAQGVRQLIIHPRPGLRTPYLSEEWFALWHEALKVAEDLDQLLWIYDENSYPSGFAGGLVPRALPESLGQGLMATQRAEPPVWTDDIIAVFAVNEDQSVRDVSTAAAVGEAPSITGQYLIIQRRPAPTQAWYAGGSYVDLLRPNVTQTFINTTLKPYEQAFHKHLGKRIRGVFTDEPHISPADCLPWTPDLPERFAQRWDYELGPHLASLFRPVGDYRRIRHNYYQLLLECFAERWAQPYFAYCDQRNLELTGHYWEHDWPLLRRVPDSMAMYAWQHRPGIDILTNQFNPHISGQFGNFRAVLELSSVANQLGKPRTLCEAYGASGYELSFSDMKRIGDWMFAMGVNTLNQHASFQSLRGARKRDHPPTFSWQQPWWKHYHSCADYFSRLSLAISAGVTEKRILVLEPTSTAWMYNDGELPSGRLTELADHFYTLLQALLQRHIEFDIGSEAIIALYGSCDNRVLNVGRCKYDVVVLPPLTENLNQPTLRLLKSFAQAGGTVICCSEPPTHQDGVISAEPTLVARDTGWRFIPADDLPDTLVTLTDAPVRIECTPHSSQHVFHQRRRLADGQLLFVTNTCDAVSAQGTITARAGFVEQWDAEHGETHAYPHIHETGECKLDFSLPPCGSLLLHFTDQRQTNVPFEHCDAVAIQPVGDILATREQLNVCLLDYVDLEVNDDIYTDIPVLSAARRIFQQHGFESNPWDRAVQADNELNSQQFGSDTGFAATYRFEIRERVPDNLQAIIERADLYVVQCNGKTVKPISGKSWIDPSFHCVDIQDAVHIGHNELRIEARPFSILHELEAVYLLGDFNLEPVNRGFTLIPTQPLRLGPWSTQGHPFYSSDVHYSHQFELDSVDGRYEINLPAWNGSVASVTVNGKHIGEIWHRASLCDVTQAMHVGINSVIVTVTGTLRNTLGPHHGVIPSGLAHPESWATAPNEGPPPGGSYDVLPYGLWEPFQLLHRI